MIPKSAPLSLCDFVGLADITENIFIGTECGQLGIPDFGFHVTINILQELDLVSVAHAVFLFFFVATTTSF